jgi:hypothetical protein
VVAADLFPSGTNLPTARVLIVKDAKATQAFKVHYERVAAMVETGITRFTGKNNPRDAWLTLVSTQDVVGIKVFSLPGPNSGTRPAVAQAVVEELLATGLSPKNIILWDREAANLRLSGFYDLADKFGIRVLGSMQAGFDKTNMYENPLLGNLVWGDMEFGRKGDVIGRKSYLSKLVAQDITKIINISPLLNHVQAGVSGNLYSLAMGSVDNVARFEVQPERLAQAVPEIYALPPLIDRVVLNIVDALICQYEGGERGLLHYSSTLNEIRFGRDPVALDVLSLEELDRQRRGASAPQPVVNRQLYKNAALLEQGVDDLKQIHIETIDLSG